VENRRGDARPALMQVLELTKPDGRALHLYSRRPISHGEVLPMPGAVQEANPHLRWHPLRGEWIAYAAHRQDRTYLPPAGFNPLAPGGDPANPTELPLGDYEVAVFDNRFPSLSAAAHSPPQHLVATVPARGRCEVVVFTQDAQTSLGELELGHVDLLLQVWAHRSAELGQDPEISYVLPFENHGVEVGVTLHHPHGQIYAYPFVPPVPQRMQQEERAYFESAAEPLLPALIEAEIASGERLLYHGEHAVAFVPAWARYPYEVWVAPIAPTPDFAALDAEQRRDLARALKVALLKYRGLWQRPFPYLMAWFQAPCDGEAHPECQLHAEFYPPYRTRDKLKYLAGTELAAGMFANDALPEDKARELQAVAVRL
jgi:UDPglucose--hexose-1-phosphate uridylyltransferase